jgi:transposase
MVGLDVHKESIEVVTAEPGAEGEVGHFGKIGGDLASVDRMVKQLRGSGRRLQFVYEAGPCGFHLYRHLTAQGFQCIVVSPSMMPRRSGDRIKTDRRDAESLARLHRAGELRAIYIPGPDDEAFRDLVRAREDAVASQTRARHRLKALLLRHGYRYAGQAGWTFRYRQWLSNVKFPTAAQQIAFQEYLDSIGEAQLRVERLTEEIRKLLPEWKRAPVVAALQALRGVSVITAVTLVAEIGDIGRFDNPRELMAYLGLVPSEHSSGPKTRPDRSRKAVGYIYAMTLDDNDESQGLQREI